MTTPRRPTRRAGRRRGLTCASCRSPSREVKVHSHPRRIIANAIFKLIARPFPRYEGNRGGRRMRPDETSIHDLVGAIYDGVADPALWQQALVQLSDATRSMGAMFIFMDRVHPMQSRYVLGRLDHDLMKVFLTHHADAPCTQALISSPAANSSLRLRAPCARWREGGGPVGISHAENRTGGVRRFAPAVAGGAAFQARRTDR